MQTASFAILPLLGVLLARGYVRSKPPGYQIGLNDRIRVAIMAYAIGWLAIGALVCGFKFAPEITLIDRLGRGLAVAGLGLAPIAVFLLITWALRATRYCEKVFHTN